MSPSTNSDSDDDFDYVPPADDRDSDSSDEEGKVEDTTEPAPPENDSAEQKKRRDVLWASFQASVSAPPSQMPGPSAVKRVKIEKTHLFAGKHVREVVEVPEDSEEARTWPRWSPHPTPESAHASGSEQGEERGEGAAVPSSPAAAAGPSPSTAAPVPRPRRPGPRKSCTTLPPIPKASQAKKITTLDKSAMDWRVHVASQSSDVKDELDANRRGGGYLEKVDFLKRVQDRKEDALEANKPTKRRKM